MITPTYLQLFNIAIMIEPTDYSAYSYLKESKTDRELQIGKVRVIISIVPASPNKLVWERFNSH